MVNLDLVAGRNEYYCQEVVGKCIVVAYCRVRYVSGNVSTSFTVYRYCDGGALA
jgi:hypothetical protein